MFIGAIARPGSKTDGVVDCLKPAAKPTAPCHNQGVTLLLNPILTIVSSIGGSRLDMSVQET